MGVGFGQPRRPARPPRARRGRSPRARGAQARRRSRHRGDAGHQYAAYASRFDVDTLAACHGHYLRTTLDAEITDDEALAQLEEHCGTLDPELLSSPRIVLVAGS